MIEAGSMIINVKYIHNPMHRADVNNPASAKTVNYF